MRTNYFLRLQMRMEDLKISSPRNGNRKWHYLYYRISSVHLENRLVPNRRTSRDRSHGHIFRRKDFDQTVENEWCTFHGPDASHHKGNSYMSFSRRNFVSPKSLAGPQKPPSGGRTTRAYSRSHILGTILQSRK